MNDLSLILRIILAMLFGGILGWQRQHKGRWAGVRTYALVSGGSALFTILSLISFGTDTARVAAGVVTGIGFLGAGTILHRENRVEGLTTAAGLWMVAAIGMAVGLKLYVLGAVSSLLVMLVFIFDYKKTGLKSDVTKGEDDSIG